MKYKGNIYRDLRGNELITPPGWIIRFEHNRLEKYNVSVKQL